MKLVLEPVGILHCSIKDQKEAPNFYTISDIKGTIEVFEKYSEGLCGLEKYEKIVVIFHFHKAQGYNLLQKRKGVGPLRGVFSLCSPFRPNPLGMSVLTLEKVEGNLLYVKNIDMLDGTPILDIKPYKS